MVDVGVRVWGKPWWRNGTNNFLKTHFNVLRIKQTKKERYPKMKNIIKSIAAVALLSVPPMLATWSMSPGRARLP